MTSDAKIGLLLGFVFILVIVSLVNGLPGLIGKDSTNGVLDTSAPTYIDNYDLDNKAKGVVQFIDDIDSLKGKKRLSGTNDDPRFTEGKKVAKGGKKESSDNKKPADNKKYYIVQKNDVLGKITRKVYGEEIGKKQSTIDMVFQANSKILDSPDDIYEGQKLFIPSLDDAKKHPTKNDSATAKKSDNPLTKFTKAFKNVLGKSKKSSSLHMTYVVKDNDNLWQIAYRRLGDGSRWTEIQKINNAILKGSNVVDPGMRLKIPQK